MNEVKFGTVCWFNSAKGFGFITADNGTDIFVHFSGVNAEGYKTLQKDQKVSFEMGVNMRGQPIAINVNIIK